MTTRFFQYNSNKPLLAQNRSVFLWSKQSLFPTPIINIVSFEFYGALHLTLLEEIKYEK